MMLNIHTEINFDLLKVIDYWDILTKFIPQIEDLIKNLPIISNRTI